MAINYPQSLTPGSVVYFRGNAGTNEYEEWTVVTSVTMNQNAGSSFVVNIADPTMVKFTNGEYVLNTADMWSTCVLVSGSGS